MKKAGIVCCSNGQMEGDGVILQTEKILKKAGILPVFSDYIYRKQSVFGGSAQERAKALTDFYENEEIEEIFDISGGDIANEILPYLNFSAIRRNPKRFWGYSDLTTVINGIYAKAGIPSVLFQVKNLARTSQEKRINEFCRTVSGVDQSLFDFDYKFIQGDQMEGVTVGGNIRCLLKLAGTQYWPEMNGKILVLEALSGKTPQIVAYLNQLKQIGVFDQIRGILLGTFTELEQEQNGISAVRLVQQYAGEGIPLAKTGDIGHGCDAKGIVIGKEILIRRGKRE
ncbi:MAG: LD-carboxypeptidase [Ruminococcus sp.]